MKKIYLTWEDVLQKLARFDKPGVVIYGVPKGGMIITGFLKYAMITYSPNQADIILDDIYDSGNTQNYYSNNYPEIEFRALFNKKSDFGNQWVVFPWEKDHPKGEETIQDNITRTLQYVGEDVTREGLLATPDRVERSYGELFSGYGKDPKDIFTLFDAEKCDDIVLLKNIELYSMCEHHMLPIIGKAHIAYIPDGKIIGISKLARLMDIYARRLQVQERLGTQVTQALNKYLKPKASACIIEASHMCMRMRGVNKQNSKFVTSSMTGAFFDQSAARYELMQLLK